MDAGPLRPDGPKRGSDDEPSGPPELMRYAGLGIEFIAIIGVFLALGWWLDDRWQTTPWLLLAGLAVGFAAGMYRLVRVMLTQQGGK